MMQYVLTEKEYHDLLFYKSEYERLLKEIERMKVFIDEEPIAPAPINYETNRKIDVFPIGEVDVTYCRNYLRDLGKTFPIVCYVCGHNNVNGSGPSCKFLRRSTNG